MNFIEAVTALKEGRCEFIQRESLGIEIGTDKLDQIDTRLYLDSILAQDWKLVNPKPIYEEVEVERYLWVNGDKEGIYKDLPFLPPACEIIKLTGTVKREVKPKVKKLVEVGFIGRGGNFVKSDIPPDTKIYAYLEE